MRTATHTFSSNLRMKKSARSAKKPSQLVRSKPSAMMAERLSNAYLYPTVLNNHFISFKRAPVRQALACAQVEAPAMPVAFDGVRREVAVSEWRSLVRTEVFDGVELSADVVE